MDFDEYDYLEKTVENPEPHKSKETANGVDEIRKSGEKDHSRKSKHKSEEKDDGKKRSKRSKSRDDLRDRGQHKERSSSHRRSRSRDGERDRIRNSREHRDRDDKDKSREERQGRDRDRVRERREPERESVRGRERGNERERESSRRSRSRSERHQGDQDDMEKSRDRELREKELREREMENRRHKDKKEEAKEPEADPERDQRTVFAYQISLKADERDVYEFFSRAGKVRDVRLIMDRISKRSKGVGYIEFYDVMSVPMAIALSGQLLLGQPVMVKPSEAEKNLVQSTTATAATGIGPYSGGARRLYVGNLHSNIKEEDLRQVFGAFGPVELVQLPPDETGNCKGFGFVQFARLEDSRNALSLNGQLEIGGRTIKVSAVTDQTGMQELGANAADFDDDEGGGLSLNARSRALLMQKLDRSGTAATSSIASAAGTPVVNSTGLSLPTAPILGSASVVSPFAPVPSLPALAGFGGTGLQVPSVTAPSIDTIGIPSECLLLKNMFDPALESEPNFDLDIKDDVQDECSKFGNLKHIYVDKNSAGLVYLRFGNAQSASAAQHALHGRWFAGKMITATYMVPQAYEAKFPDGR